MRKESLDELFNNLTSKNTHVEESNWDEFEIHLRKKMFYKFSWNRFNIYYLSIIGLSLLINAFLLSTFLSQSHSTVQNRKEIIMHADSIEFQNPETLAKENITADKNILAKKEYARNDNAEFLNKSPVLGNVEQPVRDTLNSVIIKNTKTDTIHTPVAPVVIKRKSIVYISKRDTIINIDTVKVKKRR